MGEKKEDKTILVIRNPCINESNVVRKRRPTASRPNVSHFGAGLFDRKTIKIWLEPKNNCFCVVFDSLKLRSTLFDSLKLRFTNF